MTRDKCKGRLILKLFFLTILPVFISSCDKDLYKYTKLKISEIDKLEFDEEMVEIKTDSLGNSLDTLLFVSTKRNQNGQIVYEEMIRKDELEKNYLLSDNKLFYQTMNLQAGRVKTILKSKLNNEGLVTENSFIYNNEDTNEKDTLVSIYKYDFDEKSRKKSLTISQNIKGNEGVEYISYNTSEQPISELRIAGTDTMDIKKHYFSSDGMLEKTMTLYPNYNDQFTFETIKYFYANGELRLFEKYLLINKEKKELLTRIEYELNEENKRSKSIHNYISEGKKEFRKYVYNKK